MHLPELQNALDVFPSLSPSARQSFVANLLEQCKVEDLLVIKKKLEKRISEELDLLSRLPTEIGEKIVQFLGLSCLKRMMQVSRVWCAVVNSPSVWQRKLDELSWHHPLRDTKHCQNPKLACREYLRITDAWLEEKFVRHEFKAHSDRITATRLKADILVTGSYDRSVKVWKLSKMNQQMLAEFEGRASSCVDFLLDGQGGGVVAAGSFNREIYVWDLGTKRLLRVLEGHTNPITGVCLSEDHLYASTADGAIYVWLWKTGSCVKVLTEAENDVQNDGLRICGDHLIAITYSGDLKTWDRTKKYQFFSSTDYSQPVMDLVQNYLIRTRKSAGSITGVLFEPFDDATHKRRRVFWPGKREYFSNLSSYCRVTANSVVAAFHDDFPGHGQIWLPGRKPKSIGAIGKGEIELGEDRLVLDKRDGRLAILEVG